MSKILVVDDEKGVRESIHFLLSEDGYSIDLASDGLEALKLLEHKHYDLILTDIRMPNMNGLSLLKEIKEKSRKEIPVILLTACGTIESAVNALKNGASDYIIKPFDVEHLRKAVIIALKSECERSTPDNTKSAEEYSRSMEIANQKLDQAVFELAVLHETGKTINSTLEINKIVSIILEMARQSVRADRARVVLFSENSNVNMDLSYSIDDIQSPRFAALDRYAIDWVKQKKEGLLLQDVENMKASVHSLQWTHSGIGSLLAIPIKRKNRIIGMMILTNLAGGSKFQIKDFQFINTLVNQASIAIENAQLYEEMQNHFTETIRALVTAMETKDSYTSGHSDRVTQYSLLIADQLGLNLNEVQQLEYLSLLHDVGKIGINDHILRKPSKLSETEWEVVKKHTVLGGIIVKNIKFLPKGEEIIRHHHEWYNGAGYPDGLKGENIPLFSRIIAVADAFDAMTSERPYRSSFSHEIAMDELQRCSGEQFDPQIIRMFTKVIQEKRNVA